jgi:DNA ligase-1
MPLSLAHRITGVLTYVLARSFYLQVAPLTVAAGASKRQRTMRVESSSEDEIEDVIKAAAEGADVAVGPSGASPEGDASAGTVPSESMDEGETNTKSEAEESGAIQIRSVDALVTWTKGEPVPFTVLTEAFERIADTTKRLEIQAILTETFRAIIRGSPAELLPTVYMCTNRVSPAHEGIELGLGDATLIKALAQATGRKEGAIKGDLDEYGDLGVVAAQSRGRQKQMFKPKPLTVSGVLNTFKDIASSEGAKSQDRKIKLIIKLLAAASENEAGYVMRALQGKLRIGLAEQTVLIALAHAKYFEGLGDGEEEVKEDREAAVAVVKSVYSECPSYDLLIPALLEEEDVAAVPRRVHFCPGIPVKPMLAKPTNGVAEVLEKFSDQPFTCEYKYDGERAQIHVLEDGSVKIYSRNSEDNTGKYPDIAAMFPGVLQEGVKSIVMDAEAVAYDPEKNKILPFQALSKRARKSVTVDNVTVQVCVYAFDCLYLNGEALLKKSLTERREALYRSVRHTAGKMELATAKTSHDVEELSKFLDDSVEHGTEGLIVKTLVCGFVLRPSGLRDWFDSGQEGTEIPVASSSRQAVTSLRPRSQCTAISNFASSGRLIRALKAVEPLAQAEKGLSRRVWRHV